MADKTVKINSGKTLHSFLDQVMSEGVKSALAQKALTEKEKQAVTASANPAPEEDDNDLDSLFGGDAGGGDGSEAPPPEDGGDEEQSKSTSMTMDDEMERLKTAHIKPKDIIEKLNAIRSGKSFKDSAVSKAMEDWLDSLSRTEKVALMAFTKGIAQIVTGEVSGQEAEDPGKHPADVKMNKTNGPHTIQKKPNVIKGAGGTPAGSPEQKKKAPEEDTTPPVPIQAKKR